MLTRAELLINLCYELPCNNNPPIIVRYIKNVHSSRFEAKYRFSLGPSYFNVPKQCTYQKLHLLQCIKYTKGIAILKTLFSDKTVERKET